MLQSGLATGALGACRQADLVATASGPLLECRVCALSAVTSADVCAAQIAPVPQVVPDSDPHPDANDRWPTTRCYRCLDC